MWPYGGKPAGLCSRAPRGLWHYYTGDTALTHDMKHIAEE
jgi:hypothetical protein